MAPRRHVLDPRLRSDHRRGGGAVQSRVLSVGNGVLWAEAGVGVVTAMVTAFEETSGIRSTTMVIATKGAGVWLNDDVS